MRQLCCRRGSCWHALTKPARRMARDANQPPGRSHGSPLATRATASGAFFAFLPCTHPRALCTQARVYSVLHKRDSAQFDHPHCLPPPARPQTHRPLLSIVAGAQTSGRHCVLQCASVPDTGEQVLQEPVYAGHALATRTSPRRLGAVTVASQTGSDAVRDDDGSEGRGVSLCFRRELCEKEKGSVMTTYGCSYNRRIVRRIRTHVTTNSEYFTCESSSLVV